MWLTLQFILIQVKNNEARYTQEKYESNQPQNPWSALNGCLVFMSSTGPPPHTPSPLHLPPPPLEEDASAVYSAAWRHFNQTRYTNSCHAGWKAAKHTWLVKKPVNYTDRMTRVIKRIHAAFTFSCFAPTVAQPREPATPTPLITIISEMVGFDSLVPCAFN